MNGEGTHVVHLQVSSGGPQAGTLRGTTLSPGSQDAEALSLGEGASRPHPSTAAPGEGGAQREGVDEPVRAGE
ncbi:hypothetical protein P7K49_020694, partial [Saguinus oedipus]